MKEKPILFKGPMVLRVLDDTKTQTRRVVRGQPESLWQEYCSTGDLLVPWAFKFSDGTVRSVKNPHGRPGDKLWVKETWVHYQTVDHIRRLDGRAFSEVSDGLAGYRADGFDSIDDFVQHIRLTGRGLGLEDVIVNGNRWKPSIFMPRWASRIDLEVLDVRVERLQDISAADALAEGIDLPVPSGCNAAKLPDGALDWPDAKRDEWVEGQARATYITRCADAQDHIDAFRALWDSINSKPKPVLVKKKIVSYISYPWEEIRETREHRGLPWVVYGNPMLWANTFRRVKP